MSNKVKIKRSRTDADYAPSGSARSPSPAAATPPSAVTSSARRPKTILDYLSTLPESALTDLYTDTFTVLTVYRSLPSLSKQLILRLLTTGEWIESGVVTSWCKTIVRSQQIFHHAINRCCELFIILKKHDTHYRLNPSFQSRLSLALQGANLSALLNEENNGNTEECPMSIDQLQQYSQTQWTQLLHHLVGIDHGSGGSSVSAIPPSIQRHLDAMGLMETIDDPDAPTSTNKRRNNVAASTISVISPLGFSFLFKSQHTQLWDLLLSYLTLSNSDNQKEILIFLFHLSFLVIGQCYECQSLSAAQQAFLTDLNYYGVVYLHHSAVSHTTVGRDFTASSASRELLYYTPTPLAALLASATRTNVSANVSTTTSTAANTGSDNTGHLLVETTFKVYALQPTHYQLELFSLFVRLDYRLPDMCIGTLTKNSVRRALKLNITSTEILAYLETHAHPSMRLVKPILPENVTDQIKLWESERNRLFFTDPGGGDDSGGGGANYLLQEFASKVEYSSIIQLLRSHNAVEWASESKLLIVTNDRGLTAVREFKKHQKQEAEEKKSTKG